MGRGLVEADAGTWIQVGVRRFWSREGERAMQGPESVCTVQPVGLSTLRWVWLEVLSRCI